MSEKIFELDLGDLCITDSSSFIDVEKRIQQEDKKDILPKEKEIKNRAFMAYNHFCKQLLQLRTTQLRQAESKHAGTISNLEIDPNTVKLPPMTTKLPRQHKIKQQKSLTKWEEFAQAKGINSKKKKSRMVWDDKEKDWVPRWGFKSKKQREENQEWLIEEKPGDAPYTGDDDPFLRKKKDKQIKLTKQKAREIKNQMKANKNSNKNMSVNEYDKNQLNETLKLAQKSTASLGKFDKKLKNQPDIAPPKRRQKIEFTHKQFGNQKNRNLDLMDKILNKQKKQSDNTQKLIKYGNKKASNDQ